MNKKLMRRTGGWTTALVTFIFILIPALLIIVFLGGDFSKTQKGLLSIGAEIGVVFGFVAYSFIVVIFLCWIQLTWIDIANFVIPVAIVMMGIFISYHIAQVWARGLIAIGLISVALPVNMITTRITENKIR